MTRTERTPEPHFETVPCLTLKPHPDLDPTSIAANCLPDGIERKCFRFYEDDVASDLEVAALLAVVRKGMAAAGTPSGPTIFDPNLGFVRHSGKTLNVYRASTSGTQVNYSTNELALYAQVFERIRSRVAMASGVPGILFTAPLFVTRIIGDPDWEPAEMHDEYFHAHVDGRSTPHYHYSGLLYLSTSGKDFEGGEFEFLSPSRSWNASASERSAESESQAAISAALADDDASAVQHRILPRAGW